MYKGITKLKYTDPQLKKEAVKKAMEMLEKSILIQKIGSCFQTVEPEWIILPDPNDAHSDHKITYESCI